LKSRPLWFETDELIFVHAGIRLHHLFKADEVLGLMLLTRHNITYYQDLTRGIREAIEAGRFAGFQEEFESNRALGDIEPL